MIIFWKRGHVLQGGDGDGSEFIIGNITYSTIYILHLHYNIQCIFTGDDGL